MEKNSEGKVRNLDAFLNAKFINNDISLSKDVIRSMTKKERTKYYGGKFVKYINMLSQNKFIQSMMRGFMMVIPLLVVGGIFSLIMSVPSNIVNAFREAGQPQWSEPEWLRQICQKVFNLTYGIAGILACLCITYEMTRFINRELRESKQIYPIVAVVAAFSCYMIFMIGDVYANGDQVNFSSITTDILGTRGMIPGLVIAFFVPYIYKWCYKFNWVIRLPKVVPEAVLLTVIVLIPLFFSVIVYLLPSWLVLHFTGQGIFNWMSGKLNSVYEVSNTFGFYAAYQELNALCYFLGIHNSVISNVFESVRQVNVTDNFDAITSGGVPQNIYVGATATNMIGGLGSLFMVPFAILLFCKSKQIKQIGYLALVACFFNLPEPILFGLPVILNPVLLGPLLIAPFLNAGVMWIFVHNLGMVAPYIDVAWCLPWIFVLPVATGLVPLSFGAMAACLVVSFVVWSPFVIIQDRILIKGEKLVSQNKTSFSTNDGVEEYYHDNRNGFQIIWDRLTKPKKAQEIKKLVKEQKQKDIQIKLLEQKQQDHQVIVEKQAQARLNLTKLNQKVTQNNILIVSADQEKAKKMAMTIVSGLEYQPELVLFIKTATTDKIRNVEKNAKYSQLVLMTEDAISNFEDVEIITNIKNHIVYPINDDEYDRYINQPKEIINLVNDLVVQS